MASGSHPSGTHPAGAHPMVTVSVYHFVLVDFSQSVRTPPILGSLKPHMKSFSLSDLPCVMGSSLSDLPCVKGFSLSGLLGFPL